eukprot:gene10495-biopygen7463
MSVTVDMEKVMAFLQPQFDAFDTAAVAGTISAEACQALKTDILKSAVEKAHKEALEVLHGKSSEEYTTAYVDRNPCGRRAEGMRGCSSPRTRCCTRAGRRTGYPCLTRTKGPYGVDVAEIQDAFTRLDNQCLNANCDLWKAIQELREKFAAYRPVPSQYRRNGPGKYAPGSYSTGRGQGRSGPQYRRVGGEGEAPKNE